MSKSSSNLQSTRTQLRVCCIGNESELPKEEDTDVVRGKGGKARDVFSIAEVQPPGVVTSCESNKKPATFTTSALRPSIGKRQAFVEKPQGFVDIKEVDLLFILFAKDVFSRMPGSKKNNISTSEFRRSLRSFNIYMNFLHASRVMRMFLHDLGEEPPLDEVAITLSFAHFTMLLLEIEQYSLDDSGYSLWTVSGIVHFFQSMSPSSVVDTISRIAFPIAYILQTTCLVRSWAQ